MSQWLTSIGLESYILKFRSEHVDGAGLLALENKDLESLGLNSRDRNKFKRKVKLLRVEIEKDKRQCEKERKEKEKLQKKAERLAEKASRRK